MCLDLTEHCFTYNLSETQKVAEDYSKSTWLSLYPGTSRSRRTLKSICFIRCEAAAAADQHFSCFAVELGSSLAGTGLFSFWSLGCSPWGDLLSTLSLPESPPQKDGDLPPPRTWGEGHALSTALLRLSWSEKGQFCNAWSWVKDVFQRGSILVIVLTHIAHMVLDLSVNNVKE